MTVNRFGSLIRKMWNPKAFKRHVSPHELIQQVALQSDKKFTLGKQSDPIEFMLWLLNQLHSELGGTRKKDSSIIFSTFQGKLKMETQSIIVGKMGDRPVFDLERGSLLI